MQFATRLDIMTSRQQIPGVGRLMLLDLAVKCMTFQFTASLQAIGYDRAARFDGRLDESVAKVRQTIGNFRKPSVSPVPVVAVVSPTSELCSQHREVENFRA